MNDGFVPFCLCLFLGSLPSHYGFVVFVYYHSIFLSDSLKYSVLYLIGFVFLSNFFGKIVECVTCILPQRQNALVTRLANTRVLACWSRGSVPWESKPQDTKQDDEIEVPLDVDNPDDKALIYDIDQLRNLMPKPLIIEEGKRGSQRGLLSVIKGDSRLSMNVELLQAEETLLLEWLSIVQEQKARALGHDD